MLHCTWPSLRLPTGAGGRWVYDEGSLAQELRHHARGNGGGQWRVVRAHYYHQPAYYINLLSPVLARHKCNTRGGNAPKNTYLTK